MFERGKLVQDLTLIDFAGGVHQLWDLRNRSHVALFACGPEEKQVWLTKASEHEKIWQWLGVKFFHIKEPKSAIAKGVYNIDRYGGFISHVPFGEEMWKKIEQDFLYYEAKHC